MSLREAASFVVRIFIVNTCACAFELSPLPVDCASPCARRSQRPVLCVASSARDCVRVAQSDPAAA